MSNYSISQLMTCVLARDLRDNDRIAFGLQAQMGLGAAFLAQKFHAPKLKIRHGLHVNNSPLLNSPAWSAENKTNQGVGYFESHDEILTWANPGSPQSFSNVFFIGGMQVDQWGATNLVGIARNKGALANQSKLKGVFSKKYMRGGSAYLVRGPGSIGTPSAAFFCDKYYIFTFKHDTKTFVPYVDFVSVPGTDRMKLVGYPNKRPRLCVTPLGVFNWENPEGRMQLVSLHPGVSMDQVQTQTGFELLVQSVNQTLPITPEEYEALEQIDPSDSIKTIDAIIQ